MTKPTAREKWAERGKAVTVSAEKKADVDAEQGLLWEQLDPKELFKCGMDILKNLEARGFIKTSPSEKEWKVLCSKGEPWPLLGEAAGLIMQASLLGIAGAKGWLARYEQILEKEGEK